MCFPCSRLRLKSAWQCRRSIGFDRLHGRAEFQPPHAAVPDRPISAMRPSTQAAPYVSGDAVDPQWWNTFNDPTLTELESQAVAQNLDLQIATERLLEAEAQAQIEGAVLYPTLGGAASYTREGPSKEGIFAAFGGGGGAQHQRR